MIKLIWQLKPESDIASDIRGLRGIMQLLLNFIKLEILTQLL